MSQEEKNFQISSNVDNLELFCGDNAEYKLPLRRAGFDQEKDFTYFIKNVERLVRNSTEYREWKKYVKDVLGYCNCAFTSEKSSEVTIEIHHHPVTLFTLVKTVTVFSINKEKEFCSFDIAQQCIELHFSNRVGYIPLASTIHEKYHAGFLRIPIELVHGDWRYIVDNYPVDDLDIQLIGEQAAVKLEDIKVEWTKNNYPGVVNG